MAEAQKVAVVTGAGTGIGKAAAIALVKAGYAVALAGRRKEPLEETAKEAKGKTLVVPTNVGDPASVNALFDRLKADWGRLDDEPSHARGGLGRAQLRDSERRLQSYLRGDDRRRCVLLGRQLRRRAG